MARTITDEQIIGLKRFLDLHREIESKSNSELGELLLQEVWSKARLGSREELILSEAISRLAPELDPSEEDED